MDAAPPLRVRWGENTATRAADLGRLASGCRQETGTGTQMLRTVTMGFAVFAFLHAAVPGYGQPTSPNDATPGHEIVEKISQRVRAFEAQYAGSFTRRTVETRVFDPDDGALRSSKRFVVDVWQFRGEHPENEVRECQVDGKPAALEECENTARSKPIHEVFADDADEHYRIEYGGLADWKGTRCHRLRVIPLEKTARHIDGDLFFLEDTLRLAGSKATLASYPFGLKDLGFEMTFAGQNGLPVLASGKSAMRIKVPFLFDVRIVTEFTATDQRLLTGRRDAERSPLPRDLADRSKPRPIGSHEGSP